MFAWGSGEDYKEEYWAGLEFSKFDENHLMHILSYLQRCRNKFDRPLAQEFYFRKTREIENYMFGKNLAREIKAAKAADWNDYIEKLYRNFNERILSGQEQYIDEFPDVERGLETSGLNVVIDNDLSKLNVDFGKGRSDAVLTVIYPDGSTEHYPVVGDFKLNTNSHAAKWEDKAVREAETSGGVNAEQYKEYWAKRKEELHGASLDKAKHETRQGGNGGENSRSRPKQEQRENLARRNNRNRISTCARGYKNRED